MGSQSNSLARSTSSQREKRDNMDGSLTFKSHQLDRSCVHLDSALAPFRTHRDSKVSRPLAPSRRRSSTRAPDIDRALHSSIYARQRILRPVVWPRYGTMDSISPGTTVSRVRVEEFRGLGWHHTIWQSFTLYAGGRAENGRELECEAERHGLDF
jgi:hypothetical protein